MLFTLEPLKAHEGDCLLLHWGTAASPKLAVVDGGPGDTWETSLRPRLEAIAAQRSPTGPMPIEFVMVSHVDNDHIVGIKKMFRVLKREIEDTVPVDRRTFSVRRLWHNTFNDILGDSLDAYYQHLPPALTASTEQGVTPALAAAVDRAFRERHRPGDAEEEESLGAISDLSGILAGHGEGRELRDSQEFLRAAQQTAVLNSPFSVGGTATLITAERTPSPIQLAGLGVRVVGPRVPEIEALQAAFDAYIKSKGLSVEAVLAAYTDKSVPNLSSIVCIVEHGGRRILLTGDARGDKVLASLEQLGLLAAGAPMKVDVLKVPHHGSDRNLELEFFRRIHADHYVFSGDGKHGNPERDTLAWLLASREPSARYQVVLTYPAQEIDGRRKAEALKKKNGTWNDASDGIGVLLASAKSAGHRFTVVDGGPTRIDLGDEGLTA